MNFRPSSEHFGSGDTFYWKCTASPSPTGALGDDRSFLASGGSGSWVTHLPPVPALTDTTGPCP